MKKLIGMLLLLTIQQALLFGQENLANVFSVDFNDSIYKFEIEKRANSFTIKFFNPKDTIKRLEAIFSIEDHVALVGAVMKIAEKNYAEANKIADKLYEIYSYRQNTNELQSKINIFENDKGANIGVLSLKGTTVRAYLIPRKRTDKISFNREKKERQIIAVKWKQCSDSLKGKSGDSLIKINHRCNNLYRKMTGAKLYKPQKGINRFKNLKKLYIDSTSYIKLNGIPVKLEIDSVDIIFENGIIKDIIVRTHLKEKNNNISGTTFNFSNWGYIPVRSGSDIDALSCKEKNYLSSLYSNDSIFIIDLAQIISYNRKIAFSSGTYIPKDTAIYINKEKAFVHLKKPTMSENFDIRVFTDALGYNRNAPNGIVQSEAQLNFCLNQWKNRFTLDKIWRKGVIIKNKPINRFQFLMFNRISPYFRISKIEKSNNQLPIDTVSKQGDLMDIFKYAHLDVGTELNIVTFRTDSKLFTGNIAGGVLRTKIGNEPIEANNFNVSTIYLNPNLDLKFFESNKIDFNLRYGAYVAWKVTPIDSVDLANVKTSLKAYAFDKTHWWGYFQQTINLHPGGNNQNSIFIRSAQYLSTKNNYFTFQIGYSASLSKLFNF